MPVSKTFLYPDELNQAATLLQALGHGARLCIITYLLEKGRANNKELVEYLGLSQSTVSGHLRILRDADIVLATQIETSVLYQITPCFSEQLYEKNIKHLIQVVVCGTC